MKAVIFFLLIFFTSLTKSFSQAILYNGPEVMLPNSTENYSSVKLPQGVNVSWSISGNGGEIKGVTNNQLVFFDATNSTVILKASFSNNTSFSDTIPVVPQGFTLVEGNITMTSGMRMYPINQLLRGQRFKVKPINYNGANPQLTLLSSQGRVLVKGDSIDFRSPTRGVYYVLVNSNSNGQLKVEGISPYTPPGGGVNTSSPLTQPSATVGNIAAQIDSKSNFTSAESMLTLGNKVITCIYDFITKKTIVSAYQNDQLVWTWLSNENEYLRTITADANFGISGIGSAGGASKTEDQVLVIRLNANGIFQSRTVFGTSNGLDYGYGISFLNDGSMVATGFTEGNFPNFTNAGELDAFAVLISNNGVISKTFQFGSNQNDRVFASRTLNNGNVVLFGDTEGKIGDNINAQGSFDLFLTEINTSINRVKNTQYGSNENDLAFDLVIEPLSGDIFITGQTTGALSTGIGNPQRPQVYTARIDDNLYNIIWIKQLGPNEGQSGESIALSSNGVGAIFYTFGSFNGANNNSLGTPASDDMVVALYDFNGNLNALYQFDQTLERIFARAISFEGNNIFVLRDHVYEPGKPYITTSLDRFPNPIITTSIKELENFKGYFVYPNPFSSRLFIQNNNSFYTYSLMDNLSRIIYTGKEITEQNFSFLNTGIYLLQVKSDKTNETQTFKLIKQ